MDPLPYIQYGCFGLIALIVIWDRWKGIPAMLEQFSKAHTEVVGLLIKEIGDCRDERTAAREREYKQYEVMQRIVLDAVGKDDLGKINGNSSD